MVHPIYLSSPFGSDNTLYLFPVKSMCWYVAKINKFYQRRVSIFCFCLLHAATLLFVSALLMCFVNKIPSFGPLAVSSYIVTVPYFSHGKVFDVSYPIPPHPSSPTIGCLQDGLLTQGCTDFIHRAHAAIPQITSDGKRLQVLVKQFSRARLLAFENCKVWFY